MPQEAFVTPDLIRWARERANLSQENAADHLKIRVDRLNAWETGDARPSLRQAQQLASRLNVPFGYLYLSERPQETISLPDLRTVGDEPAAPPSPELADTIDDVLRKQEWFREYKLRDGAEPLAFVGRYSLDASHEDVATDIRATIGITPQLRQESANWETFLRLLVQRTESAGVLVLRNGVVGSNTHRKLSVSEFRGFVVTDGLAPIIFLNGSDALSAQIFTLVHELAHIWIGESGISNPDYRLTANEQSNAIERFCNRTAAEVLVPANDIIYRWGEPPDLQAKIQELARAYRVSRIVVLRRARDLNLITSDAFFGEYQRLAEEQRERDARAGSGGDFYNTLVSRSSATFIATLMSAVAEGELPRNDAAVLLGVRVKTLNAVAEHTLGVPLDG